MDIAIGLIAGCLITITSIILTVNHMIDQDKKKNLPGYYDIEINSRGKKIKGILYMKKRKNGIRYGK